MTIHVDDLPAPASFKFFLQRRLERHELEGAEFRRLAVHGVLRCQIPESTTATRIHVVVINNGPRQANQFVLCQHGLDGPLRTFGASVIERSYPEFQYKLSRLAGGKTKIVGGVGPR